MKMITKKTVKTYFPGWPGVTFQSVVYDFQSRFHSTISAYIAHIGKLFVVKCPSKIIL